MGFARTFEYTDQCIAIIRTVNKIDHKINRRLKKQYIVKTKGGADLMLASKSELFFPLQSGDENKRAIWYIAASSGSGKTYFSNEVVRNYKALYPDRKIYYMSKNKIDEDPSFNKATDKDMYTIINPDVFCETLANGYEKDKADKTDDFKDELALQFEDSLILCDDISNLSKDCKKLINGFIDLVLERFRHFNTSLILIRHVTCDGPSTKMIILESNYFVTFPHIGMTNNRIFSHYFKINPKLLKESIKEIENDYDFIMIAKKERFLLTPYRITSLPL